MVLSFQSHSLVLIRSVSKTPHPYSGGWFYSIGFRHSVTDFYDSAYSPTLIIITRDLQENNKKGRSVERLGRQLLSKRELINGSKSRRRVLFSIRGKQRSSGEEIGIRLQRLATQSVRANEDKLGLVQQDKSHIRCHDKATHAGKGVERSLTGADHHN